MLACRLGAGKVYAIEPDGVIELAREAARSNGFADRIEFSQDFSTRVNLPEPVDVLVSDLRTVLPWFEQHIPTIIDARQRLLKPGGVLIPEQDTLWAAVVEMPEFYAHLVGHQPQDTAGFDMSAARKQGSNGWAKARAQPQQLLSEPLQCATLDYQIVTDADLDVQISWKATRSGTAHGFVAWFEAILTGDISFSNSPSAEPLLYGNAFFPWPDPVAVSAGDAISVSLRANLFEGEYIWRWDTIVTKAGEDEPCAQFSQSNISLVKTIGSLRLRAGSYVAVPTARAAIDRFILERMDGNSSSREIAEALAGQFPDEFSNWEAALEAVGDLSVRYSG
jgi:protein arginine N-methyltransferase 1